MNTWRNLFVLLTTIATIAVIITAIYDNDLYRRFQLFWLCFWSLVGFSHVVSAYMKQPSGAKHPVLFCCCVFLVAGTCVTVIDAAYVAVQYLFFIGVPLGGAHSVLAVTNDDMNGLYAALALGLAMAIPIIAGIQKSNNKYLY